MVRKKGIMTSRVSPRRIANYNGRGDHRRYELRHGLESGASGATVNGLAGESLVRECLYVRAARFAICRHTHVREIYVEMKVIVTLLPLRAYLKSCAALRYFQETIRSVKRFQYQ